MTNIIPHNYKVTQDDRNGLNKHRSVLIWFTGLSGSGKSTIASALEATLFENSLRTYTLDGDNIRNGINKDLTFSADDRTENIRRIAEIAKLLMDAGLIVLGAFVSPYRKDRKDLADIVGPSDFIEVFVNTSLEECERRDVKGLYKKARSGEIKNLTGIDAPYEAPVNPDVEIKTEEESVDQAVLKILNVINKKIRYE